ncbi:MAG: phenylalanine--tRNA ligase subunit beta, partial [Candidatus Levyibacteriota bacterium]
MNIQILDSWLREHLETKASVKQIAEILSLTSVSVERIEQVGRDYLYDIEVTTNRPDLMSVVGLAREATVALRSEGITAKFIEKKHTPPKNVSKPFPIEVISHPKLTQRICAVILSVKLDKSPQVIRDRLEATDIRSIDNVVDVTNYVMRELGHPMHAFDFDKLKTKKMIIREAKSGEKIVTLDKKEYTLSGGEIVADNGENEIIDLLGIMGTENSAVSEGTRNVLLFVDNNNKHKIRKASMELGIRTDAAILNEKGIDPELSMVALLRGIELLQEIAGGKIESTILDIYPKKIETKEISVSFEKINSVIGVPIPAEKVVDILQGLNFTVKKTKEGVTVTPPSARFEDIQIPEDIIEEVARMYGYHKLSGILPPTDTVTPLNLAASPFYWEQRAHNALKYWGFTEVYTYSLVSEDMLEVPTASAVKIANPLGTDMAYMRTTLIPSLLDTVRTNKSFETVKIFELANVYYKKADALPEEISFLSGAVKKDQISFFEIKGVIEGLFADLGITKYEFKKTEGGGAGADIFVWGKKVGEIEILERSLIDFEINFTDLLKYVSMKKTYNPVPKFPAAVEDLRIII